MKRNQSRRLLHKFHMNNRRRNMQLTIRRETPADYRAVEALTRDAFWGWGENPMCDGEHLIVHRLRESTDIVPELDFVAEANGMLVGHIIYAKAQILSPDGQKTEVLTFGPLSVLPRCQKQGNRWCADPPFRSGSRAPWLPCRCHLRSPGLLPPFRLPPGSRFPSHFTGRQLSRRTDGA